MLPHQEENMNKRRTRQNSLPRSKKAKSKAEDISLENSQKEEDAVQMQFSLKKSNPVLLTPREVGKPEISAESREENNQMFNEEMLDEDDNYDHLIETVKDEQNVEEYENDYENDCKDEEYVPEKKSRLRETSGTREKVGWIRSAEFNTEEEFKRSEYYSNLADFSKKGSKSTKSGVKHNFVCKMGRRNFSDCPAAVRVTYCSAGSGIVVELSEADHEHQVKDMEEAYRNFR